MTLGEYAVWLLVAGLGCIVAWLFVRRIKRKDNFDPMEHPYGDWPRGNP